MAFRADSRKPLDLKVSAETGLFKGFRGKNVCCVKPWQKSSAGQYEEVVFMRSTPAHGTSIFTRSINTNTPAASSLGTSCVGRHMSFQSLISFQMDPNGSTMFYPTRDLVDLLLLNSHSVCATLRIWAAHLGFSPPPGWYKTSTGSKVIWASAQQEDWKSCNSERENQPQALQRFAMVWINDQHSTIWNILKHFKLLKANSSEKAGRNLWAKHHRWRARQNAPHGFTSCFDGPFPWEHGSMWKILSLALLCLCSVRL